MKPYQTITMLLVAVCLTTAMGCFPQIDTDNIGGKIVFNQRLMPGGGASEGKAVSDYYTDGGPQGDEIISELYHSTVSITYLRKLRKSQYFWVEGDGFALLSLEPLIENIVLPIDDNNCTYEGTIGSCGGDLRDSETRQLIECDGHTLVFTNLLGMTVGLRGCTDCSNLCSDTDEKCKDKCTAKKLDYSQGVILDDNCTVEDVANFSAEYANPLPLCMIRSAVPSLLQDTTIELMAMNSKLENINNSFPRVASDWHTVLPHMQVVNGARQLARPLIWADRDEPHDPNDPTSDIDRYYWQWRVPLDKDNTWQENFSPNLQVNTVRVFVEREDDPDTGLPLREYLTPKNVHINGTRCTSDPEDGTTFSLITFNKTVTPTYDKENLDQVDHIDDALRLNWEVEFQVVKQEGTFKEPPVHKGDPVYIEFEVVDTSIGTTGAGLRIEPGGMNLGDVRLNASPTFERVFTVINEGMADAIVDSIDLEGRDAGDFSARVHSGKSLPLLLRAGRSFEVTLDSHAKTWGLKQADVVVKGHGNSSAQPVEIRARVFMRATDAMMNVAPEVISFHRDDDVKDKIQYQRRFLAENSGGLDLHRRDVVISGPDASAFSILSSRYQGVEDSPAPISRWIAPANDETFTILYHPTSQGMHSARIDIDSDAGQESVDLHGVCYGTCNYAP